MQWLFFLEVQVDLEIITNKEFSCQENVISFDKTRVFPTCFEQ